MKVEDVYKIMVIAENATCQECELLISMLEDGAEKEFLNGIVRTRKQNIQLLQERIDQIRRDIAVKSVVDNVMRDALEAMNKKEN